MTASSETPADGQASGAAAYLFPGQGAQKAGMAVDLCERSARARAVFEEGARVLGFDVLALCRDGPQEELDATRVSQPAIFLHSMAALEAISERFLPGEGSYGHGIAASAAAGLSLGEYSALVFAGSLRFEDALRVVGHRGEYMQEACDARRGAMASVLGLDAGPIEETVEELAGEGLEIGIANYNAPGQTVISGAEEAVARCEERLREAGARRVIRLRVAGAYHSPLMRSATKKLEPLLKDLEIRPPRLPFFGNCRGGRVEDPEEIRRGLLLQVESPVRWVGCLRGIADLGARRGYEVGPGSVLKGLARNTVEDLDVTPLGTAEALDNLEGVPV